MELELLHQIRVCGVFTAIFTGIVAFVQLIKLIISICEESAKTEEVDREDIYGEF